MRIASLGWQSTRVVAVTSMLYVRAAGARVAVRRHGSRVSLRAPDERLVFVFGCPRSGTTFLAGAIGAVPGFVDLGEVHPSRRRSRS